MQFDIKAVPFTKHTPRVSVVGSCDSLSQSRDDSFSVWCVIPKKLSNSFVLVYICLFFFYEGLVTSFF